MSQLCQGLDERVQRFKQRALESTYPDIWLDAKYLKVREGDRVVSMAFVVATGVTQSGDREILGFDIGLNEEAAFWAAFLRDLVARGLRGVQLVISDAHTGLQAAIRQVLQGVYIVIYDSSKKAFGFPRAYSQLNTGWIGRRRAC